MIPTDAPAQLEALAQSLAGASSSSADSDGLYYQLIAPAMLDIDGRTMAQGFRYTLNVTNALQGRPKHWYLELFEYNTANPGTALPSPCQCGLLCVPDQASGFSWYSGSIGHTIGLATCATICRAWAQIIRLWLAGQYPLAISQPTA